MAKRWRLAACACLCIAGPALAEWVQVDTSADGAVWYMDPVRSRTVGNHRQAWVKVDHTRDRSVAYRSSLELFSYNCDARTSRILSFTDYDSMGKVMRTQTQPDYGYETGYSPVVPDSIGETLMNRACGFTDGG